MLVALIDLLLLGLIGLTCLGVGYPVVCAWSTGCETDERELTLWSLPTGLILCGLILGALGLVGVLYPALICALTLLGTVAGGFAWRDLVRIRRLRRAGWLTSAADSTSDLQTGPAPWLLGSARWIVVMIGAATLLSALTPPTAGDALVYHLQLPQRYLAEHALVYLPYDDNGTFPLLAEMWYLWGLAISGGTLAQLLHWSCGALAAGATWLLAAPLVGRRWGEVAAAVVLLTPGVNNQMTAPLNDLALATLTTLALAAWWRGAIDDRGKSWYLLAGIFLAGALGTKYIALLFVAALGVASAVVYLRRPEQRRALLVGCGTMLLVATSLAGPWYLRAAWHRGDPVYPFFSQHAASADLPRANKRPLGVDPVALVTAPWQVTMHPERIGGRAHQLGPLLLAVLPGLILVRRLRGAYLLALIAATFTVQWLVLRQNVRFLLPVVPILAVPIVWTLSEWRRWSLAPRWIATAAVLAVAAFCTLVPLRRAARNWQAAVGIESRPTYLARVEPTYAMGQEFASALDRESHVLSLESRLFYLPGRATRENIYRRETSYATEAQPLAVLRSAGFTHLLLAEAHGGEPYDRHLSELVEQAQRETPDAAPELLRVATTRDEQGTTRQYRLLRLR